MELDADLHLKNPNSSQNAQKIDYLYVFAILLLMLSFFDLGGNLFGFSISYAIFSNLVTFPESFRPFLNLLLNLSAQIGGILGFLVLYSKNRIEPEQRTAPPGQFGLTTYSLYAFNTAFAISALLGVIFILEDILKLSTASPYEAISPTVALTVDPLYLLLFFLVLTVGAPVLEELIFRRTLIPLLERRGLGQLWTLIISSLIFSLRHTPADLLAGSLGFAILHIFVTLPGGLLLGFLYLRTRNVFWPILLHALTNGMSAIAQIAEVRYTELNETFLVMIFGLWAMIAIMVGLGLMLYWGYQFINYRSLDQKPVWLQIFIDSNANRTSLNEFIKLAVIFILFMTGIPIIFEQIRSLIESVEQIDDLFKPVMIYTVETLFYIVLIAILAIYISKKTQLTMTPLIVSTSLREWKKPSQTIFETTTTGELCPNCGNVRSSEAKFCYFCGIPFD
jgi:membrane protease YdiL (CAAX protease family)